jgi:glutamate 5-kinase
MNRTALSVAKRIVIKIGTSSLMTATSAINLLKMRQLAAVISQLMSEGREILLVSSGAVGAGMGIVGLEERPESVSGQQALAAIGQAELMRVYGEAFNQHGLAVGQVLLTRDVMDDKVKNWNAQATLNELLSHGVLPIINENDTVATDELDHHRVFGDNDLLSAMVTDLVNADLLIVLSDVDGFFSDNPMTNPDAVRYSEITKITPELREQASGSITALGTGGMLAKLNAAEIVMASGSVMVLAHGHDPSVIEKIVAGEDVGTMFSTHCAFPK